MLAHQHPHTRGLTLLEVIVALTIVLVAMTVFIPALLELRSNAGDITCQNNLRQLGSALEMYNLDHNGSMPYGIYYRGSGPPTWEPPKGNFNDFVSWASELNAYFKTTEGYAEAFRCPQAQQQAPPHAISYVMNFIVGVSPYSELVAGTPPRAQTKPPSLHLMLHDRPPGTALIWDTAIRPDLPWPEGYLVGADLDNQRFWDGARTPQFRYFLPHDPIGQIPPQLFGNERPVSLNVSSYTYRNIDPPAGTIWPYQGNLRFRHDKQTRCNALFSDGSVRQFTAVVNKNLTVATHDARRRYFMIHWPPGVTPNPSYPQ